MRRLTVLFAVLALFAFPALALASFHTPTLDSAEYWSIASPDDPGRNFSGAVIGQSVTETQDIVVRYRASNGSEATYTLSAADLQGSDGFLNNRVRAVADACDCYFGLAVLTRSPLEFRPLFWTARNPVTNELIPLTPEAFEAIISESDEL